MRRRNWTRGKRLAGRYGHRSGRNPGEVGRATAVRTTRRVVPMDVRRYRNVLDASEAAQARGELFGIELRRSEGFEDLRTCVGLLAAMEHAVCRKAAGQVRIVRPPDRCFVA